jgi:hypothetical protein
VSNVHLTDLIAANLNNLVAPNFQDGLKRVAAQVQAAMGSTAFQKEAPLRVGERVRRAGPDVQEQTKRTSPQMQAMMMGSDDPDPNFKEQAVTDLMSPPSVAAQAPQSEDDHHLEALKSSPFLGGVLTPQEAREALREIGPQRDLLLDKLVDRVLDQKLEAPSRSPGTGLESALLAKQSTGSPPPRARVTTGLRSSRATTFAASASP